MIYKITLFTKGITHACGLCPYREKLSQRVLKLEIDQIILQIKR